jgi:hypothetical protein
MVRTGRTGTSSFACSHSRGHVHEGHLLRSTVSFCNLHGRSSGALSWDRMASDPSVADPQVDWVYWEVS